ncbi:hypothetical protein [Aquipuribacter sp. MA13-6]|uniref:hypothetical protein n=1 Tax=unclassified Aquipuribacter TaxID=2635084 RepID=UPI003EEB88DE
MPASDVPPDAPDSPRRDVGAPGPATLPAPEDRPRAGQSGLWIAVAVGTMCALFMGGFIVVMVWGWWVYANHDRIGWIDDPVVADAAEQACARLHADLDDVPVTDGAPDAQQAAEIQTQNDIVLEMGEDVRSLGERRLSRDIPSQAWLEDWEDLVESRETYADNLLAGGDPELLLPTVDDVPIIERMESVVLDCDVPLALLNVPAPAG